MVKGQRWWHEGRDHIRAKEAIRAVCKRYGANCVEECEFPVDLHDIDPILWPKSHKRGYQADLLITKTKGKQVHKVIAEIDGLYHHARKDKDALRDLAIPAKYGIRVVRFDKEMVVKGRYSDEEIAEKLGLLA